MDSTFKNDINFDDDNLGTEFAEFNDFDELTDADFEDDFNEEEIEFDEDITDEELNFDDGITDEDIEFDESLLDDDIINDAVLESYAEEEYGNVLNEEANFISDTGDIVVMDTTDNGENFKIVYVDIESIAIAKRIRKTNNVEALVRSIKSTGLLNPIVVAPTATEGIYVLLDGYRRIIACAKAGKRNIPCIVNSKVSTPEIPILEALYNHNKSYAIKEMVDYIDYLEKEKGIMSASMIEYLLQMNNGDYTKLKDIINDNDDDIVDKLFMGIYTIEQAFKKLEQRRKKETAEQKELQKADKVYGNEEESGVASIQGNGEEADDVELSDEELKSLALDPTNLDDGLEEESLEEMIEDGKNTPGFEAHKQKVGEREYIDPVIKKTVLARDKYTCQCCKRGGEVFVDALDFHHILPVYLSGTDTPENGITLCLTDHRLVHLYAVGDLYIPSEKTEKDKEDMTEEERILYNDEQMRFKRIIKLGSIIRDGMALKGIKREQFKKDQPVGSIGRNKPGKGQDRG